MIKRLLSLVIVGSLIVLLAEWGLSQVPAGFLRSGIVTGQTPTVAGTASFSATGGSIGSLVTTGCITGVTHTSTGRYTVALTGPPSNYLVTLSLGDSTAVVTPQVVGPLSSTGFLIQSWATVNAAVYDPALVMISVIAN